MMTRAIPLTDEFLTSFALQHVRGGIYARFILDSLLAANCVFSCWFLTSTNQVIKIPAVARSAARRQSPLAMAY